MANKMPVTMKEVIAEELDHKVDYLSIEEVTVTVDRIPAVMVTFNSRNINRFHSLVQKNKLAIPYELYDGHYLDYGTTAAVETFNANDNDRYPVTFISER